MLAPIIVDLGPNVAQAELEIVLDACNEAIQNGVCLPDSAGYPETPRATAIARPTDASVLAVRIEVRLRVSEQLSWIVRELSFEAEDPAEERWRSVGLAIATLVGEGERRDNSEASPKADAPGAAPSPAVPASPRASRGSTELSTTQEPSVALWDGPAWAGVFFGVGLLAGPGFDDGAWRLGGNVRAGWEAASGWHVLSSVSYSLRASEETFTASWLLLQAGLGYRLRLSERLSSAFAVHAGAQRMRFEVLANDVTRSEALWNPLVTLSVDGWWLAGSGFGFWAAVNTQSIGRESRLFVAPRRPAVSSPPVEITGLLGVGWWIQ